MCLFIDPLTLSISSTLPSYPKVVSQAGPVVEAESSDMFGEME